MPTPTATELSTKLSEINDVDDLLAVRNVVEMRLAEAREHVKAQAEALGMKCAVDNGQRKKAKRNSAKHDAD